MNRSILLQMSRLKPLTFLLPGCVGSMPTLPLISFLGLRWFDANVSLSFVLRVTLARCQRFPCIINDVNTQSQSGQELTIVFPRFY